MIGRLTGRVLECTPARLLLDVGGVGYELQIPLSTYYEIAAGASGRPVSLHVHTHVREDALQLYGFAGPSERAAFETLIAISGVGPRMAIAVLSGIGIEDLRAAVRSQDRDRLQKIPGVGRKTAERILLELRDRLERMLAPTYGRAGAPAVAPGVPGGVPQAATPRDDAISALVNLGYSSDKAERAVDAAHKALGSEAQLEAVLKSALSGLVR